MYVWKFISLRFQNVGRAVGIFRSDGRLEGFFTCRYITTYLVNFVYYNWKLDEQNIQLIAVTSLEARKWKFEFLTIFIT